MTRRIFNFEIAIFNIVLQVGGLYFSDECYWDYELFFPIKKVTHLQNLIAFCCGGVGIYSEFGVLTHIFRYKFKENHQMQHFLFLQKALLGIEPISDIDEIPF